MASQPQTPTLAAKRFVDANREARLVYQSTDGDGCFFRLEDGRTFDLSATDCRSIIDYAPRWRHLDSVA